MKYLSSAYTAINMTFYLVKCAESSFTNHSGKIGNRTGKP